MRVQAGIEDFFRVAGVRAYEEEAEALVYVSGVNYAPCNGIFERSGKVDLSKERMESISAKMEGLPFIWWTDDHRLEDFGFNFEGELIGIERRLKKLNPINADIRAMQGDAENWTYTEVSTEALGLSVDLNPALYPINNTPGLVNLMAYVDEKPAASITLLMGETTASLWNLGTLPQYRHKGLASKLIHEGMRIAYEHGHRWCMALLLPTSMAFGLAERFRFTQVSRHPFFCNKT